MAENITIQGFAPQIAPMAEEAFTEAQNIFQQRMGEGYQRPETPLFTPFTQPELEAQQQTLNIAAGPLARPAIQESAGMTRAGASGVGSLIPGLMNPYTQQVADATKRRFAENYQRQVLNPLDTSATVAGGFRGARAGVERALARERMQRGLADIDAQLLDKAFQQSATLAEQQRRRELTAAPEISRLGLVDLGQQLMSPELQASVGEAQRGQLDLARQAELGQELSEQQFPETSLQQYLNFLGLGRAPTQTTQFSPDAVGSTGAPQRPTLGQQIGTGLSLLTSLPKAVSGVSQAVSAVPDVISGVSKGLQGIGSFLGFAEGGSVSGLSSLPTVRMQEGGRPPNIFAPDMRSEIVRQQYINLLAAQKQKPTEQPQMSPGQTADYIDRIQNIQYQRESPLGSLVDLGIGLGTAKMRGDQAAIDATRAARAAKIKSESEMLDTVLGIEDKGAQRDEIISENVRSTMEAAVKAEESYQEAIKGDRSNAEIESRAAAVERTRRSSFAAVQAELARLGSDPASVAALQQYVKDIGAAERIQAGETVPTPTNKQQESDNVLSESIKKTRRERIEQRLDSEK